MSNIAAQNKYVLNPGTGEFAGNDKVTVQRVSFKNQYQMEVVGNLFMVKGIDLNQQHAAIVVGHPMGAVKEQSANVYASYMAERGFVTLSIDLSFWGESEGEPRNAVAPEIYAEDFSAAVDYLGTRHYIDRERIGAIGICGSGSFVISAAKIDPRIRAIATISMYNMGNSSRHGLNHSLTSEQRKQIIATAAQQRYAEFEGAEVQVAGGTVLELTPESGPIEREFYEFYRNPDRGEFTPKGASPLKTTKPTVTSKVKFMNFYPFNDIETISPRPMLFITGDQAHSKEFSEDAYKRAAEPKELYYVKGAGHVDLYDRLDVIPFDKLDTFFKSNLK
ncbi:MAG: alpha/beta hydrolase [Bacteroidales bacterium]|nr:alpha/beta hydrolase [Bacteroidales bacterium]